MTQEIQHNGQQFWITAAPTIHQITNEAGFTAFVSRTPPNGLFFGEAVKDHDGRTMFFGDQLAALTNARAVVESYY
jgi:hypothetical protein